MNAREVPVYASERMVTFLRTHAPWNQLVAEGHITLHPVSPGHPFILGSAVEMTPAQVPHRQEWSDTLAFYIRGKHQSLFYCPDTDTWQGWPDASRFLLQQAQIALLDGTFYSRDELPGRNLEEIPHPVVSENMAFLRDLNAAVTLIHLNHSNPLLDSGDARNHLQQMGLRVGRRGDSWVL